jgi:nitrile hydratase accessory protein
VFDEPWQAQVFALVVQLNRQDAFTWNEWAEALAQAIAAAGPDDGAGYYRSWLAALETLATAKGLTEPGALAELKAAWAEAYRMTPHGRPVNPTPLRPGG